MIGWGLSACTSGEDESPPIGSNGGGAPPDDTPTEEPNLVPVIDELTVSNGWADPVPQTCAWVQETKLYFKVVAHDQDEPADELVYQWSFVSLPTGSNAFFDDDSSANPSFVPDVAGEYEVQVTVRDVREGTVSQSVTVQGVKTGSQLASQAAYEAADVIREIFVAAEFIPDMAAAEAFGSGLGALGDIFGDDDEDQSGSSSATTNGFSTEDDNPDDDGWPDPDEVSDKISEIIEVYLLPQEQLELDEPCRSVFLLAGDLLCDKEALGPDHDCDNPPYQCDPWDTQCQHDLQQWVAQCQAEEAQDHADCVSTIDDIEMRVVARPDGPNVALDLLIGPKQTQVGTVTVGADSLQFDSDLTDIGTAIAHISSVVDEEPIQAPEVTTGKLSLRLERMAPEDLKFTAQIAEALELGINIPDAGLVNISAQEAMSLAEVRVQGGDVKKLTGSVDLNPVKVTIPLADMFEYGVGDFIVEVPGLQFGLELTQANNRADITQLGFGNSATRVLHDQTVLATFDFNAQADRHVDLSIYNVGGQALFDLFPGVFLNAYVNFGDLNQYMGPEDDPFSADAFDQTYQFSFSSPSEHPQFMPVSEQDSSTGQAVLKLMAGDIYFTSDATSATFLANEGQCMVPMDEELCQPGHHETIECGFEFVTCPQ